MLLKYHPIDIYVYKSGLNLTGSIYLQFRCKYIMIITNIIKSIASTFTLYSVLWVTLSELTISADVLHSTLTGQGLEVICRLGLWNLAWFSCQDTGDCFKFCRESWSGLWNSTVKRWLRDPAW